MYSTVVVIVLVVAQILDNPPLPTFVFKTEKCEKKIDENLATCAQNKFRFVVVVGKFPHFSKYFKCFLVIYTHKVEEGHTNT